jgi:tetratricopeptide (TPR) repeat protein
MNKLIKEDLSIVKDIFRQLPCLTAEQLAAYHRNRVSGQERFEIENHLSECPLCSEALEGLASAGSKTNFKHDLSGLQASYKKRFHPEKLKQIYWKPIFAAAAILVLVFTSLFTLVRQPSHESLFMHYFQVYPNTTPLVRGNESAGMMENAMMEYEAKNYADALNILSDVLLTDPDNTAALFYTGILYLTLKQPDLAIPYLKRVTTGSNDFLQPAAWYLGLAYLRDKKISLARTAFQEIAGKDGLYQEQAINLLKKMD